MRRSPFARFTVLLLIGGILAGGSGAPILDAALYHRDPARSHCSPAHIEPQGTRHDHGDACTLGWLARVQPPRAALPSFLPVVAVFFSTPQVPRAPAPRRAGSVHRHRSRAPPTRSA